MAEPKTKPTGASVGAFLDAIQDEGRRRDSRRLTALMSKVTGEKPRMWGSGIVGFGTVHTKYASGREGDWPQVGFAPRKRNLTIYLMSGFVGYEDLLSKLGQHTTGKACLYVKSLDAVDEEVLTELVRRSVAHVVAVEAESGGVPRMAHMPPIPDQT